MKYSRALASKDTLIIWQLQYDIFSVVFPNKSFIFWVLRDIFILCSVDSMAVTLAKCL